MLENFLPIGKLPINLLKELLSSLPPQSSGVILGPGIGLDCAVVETSNKLLVLKSDPITFASDKVGWYLVQINVNDLVTTGAIPRWLMATILLPEKDAERSAREISSQITQACNQFEISIIGGHTEITHDINRPILIGTLIGEVDREQLITPKGAQPGDHLLLTKEIPIEAISILGREFPDLLKSEPCLLSQKDIDLARNYLTNPGISIYQEARAAVKSGGVHAMHDPTEGGLYAALWELADASQLCLRVDLERVNISPLARRICNALNLDPLGAISSGALLLAVSPEKSPVVLNAIHQQGIACVDIGEVCDDESKPIVLAGFQADAPRLPRPERDEIAKLY